MNTALLDLRATCHFNQTEDGLELTRPSDKAVAVAFEQTSKTMTMALLPMNQLSWATCETHILPVLKANSLMSVKTLAENGYMTIFHPYQGRVTVHDAEDV